MKISVEDKLYEKELGGSLNDALDLLIRDLSTCEALEYCADQELTRTLERIAERISIRK
jgi:hypothetical protein